MDDHEDGGVGVAAADVVDAAVGAQCDGAADVDVVVSDAPGAGLAVGAGWALGKSHVDGGGHAACDFLSQVSCSFLGGFGLGVRSSR